MAHGRKAKSDIESILLRSENEWHKIVATKIVQGKIRVGTSRQKFKLPDCRNRWLGRRVRSGHGTVAKFTVEDGHGLCNRATSRSASCQPSFQFARQSDGDASERSHRNDDAKTEHCLRAAAK